MKTRKKRVDNKRNDQVVGNNSKSYSEKHPEHPIHLRPIREAIQQVPKIKDEKGRLYPNHKEIGRLRKLGSTPWFGKQDMEVMLRDRVTE
jgi:hypothetical protein